MLKKAVLDLARANKQGITNADAASLLGLRSDYRGQQSDYLTYSVLGLLLREGKINRVDEGRSALHRATEDLAVAIRRRLAPLGGVDLPIRKREPVGRPPKLAK